ncbi:hypothetical protein TSAR_017110 [Trichomalopsis sarcophagae]|uniref:Uncharacterized protein n=1 Tax=Trichomalopsis sarcophagae TaxID=543379 RepID=A0A232FGN8_9HYME|nr:hypothetical protein TSAR_017110 [Trichomalopsis sarcophagae]
MVLVNKSIMVLNIKFIVGSVIIYLAYGDYSSCVKTDGQKTSLIDYIDYVNTYINQNIHFNQLTLLTKYTKTYSLISATIINHLIKNFPTTIIDTYELNTNSIPIDTNIIHVKELLKNWIERKYFKVIVMETKYEKNISSQLAEYINFLNDFTVKSVRPKCLIFVIMKILKPSINVLPFLKYSWKNMFLDITVIEIAEQYQFRASLQTLEVSDTGPVCHQYNPFNQEYRAEHLKPGMNLFVNKLNQLHGITLRVGINEEPPDVMINKKYQGDKISNALFGYQISMARIISEVLNFSIYVKIVTEPQSNLTRFNVHYYEEYQALKENYIDFMINYKTYTGIKPLHPRELEISNFIGLEDYHVLVKQYTVSPFNISNNFSMLLIIIVISLTFFMVLSRLLRQNQKVWTIMNLAKIMLGISVTERPQTFFQRLIFLFLAFLSIIFTTNVIDQLIYASIARKTVLDLQTLQNLLDSGIIPSISENLRTVGGRSNYTTLQKVLNISRHMESHGLLEDCLKLLIEGDKDVSGCDLKESPGRLIAEAFSDTEADWILSIVDEPLACGYDTMLFAWGSPFADRFYQITHRLFVSGVTENLYEVALKNFSHHSTRFMHYRSSNGASNLEFSINLSCSKLIFFLMVGYMIALVSLAVEMNKPIIIYNVKMLNTSGLIHLLLSYVIYCGAFNYNNNFSLIDLTNYVNTYINTNFRYNKLTLLTRCTYNFSDTSTTIISKLTQNFPSLIIDINDFTTNSISVNVVHTKQLLGKWTEKNFFKIIIMETSNDTNILSQLAAYIDFLNSFTIKSVRPKCLIFVMTKTQQLMLTFLNLLEFFKYSWANMFLDVTIIEIAQQYPLKTVLQIPQILHFEIVFHKYNPFKEEYKKVNYYHGINLFDNMLQQLHGWTLHAGFYDEPPDVMIDQSYQGKEILNALFGYQVLMARIIAEVLNFTLHVKLVTEPNLDLTRFNVCYYKEIEALKENRIDFMINHVTITGRTPVHLLKHEISDFFSPETYHILVKQKTTYLYNIFENFKIPLIVAAIYLVFFTILSKLLRHDGNVWTIKNMTKIVLGISINERPRYFVQRLLFLYLALLSIVITTNLLDVLLLSYIDHKTVLKLRTLQDLLDSGITPSLSNNVKTVAKAFNNTVLQQVINISQPMENYGNLEYCLKLLVEDDNDVSGCDLKELPGRMISKAFSNTGEDWVLTLVDEPLLRGHNTMLFAWGSPFADRFYQITHRLFVSRVSEYLYEIALKNFSRHSTRFMHRRIVTKTDELSISIQLSSSKLILFFTIGYALAFLSLVVNKSLNNCKPIQDKNGKVTLLFSTTCMMIRSTSLILLHLWFPLLQSEFTYYNANQNYISIILDNCIDYVNAYIKQNVQFDKLTLLTKYTRTLSSPSNVIIKKLICNFPVFIIDIHKLKTYSEDTIQSKRTLIKWTEKNILK